MAQNKWILLLGLLLGILALVLLVLFVVGIFNPAFSPFWLGTGVYLQTDGKILIVPKTLWDLASLLIIPIVLSFGVLFYNQAVKNTETIKTESQNKEKILQDYIDRMSTLITDKGLTNPENSNAVRSVARTQTRTTIYRLSGSGKGLVIRFLKEGGLIEVEDPIIQSAGLDLRFVNLKKAHLNDCNFSHANFMNAELERVQLQNGLCFKTNFTKAILPNADLRNAVLSRAIFHEANCFEINLTNTELIKTIFTKTNLQNAIFHNAKMNGADFREANVCGARFDKADVSGAKFENARYNLSTQWPEGFDPQKAGLTLVTQ